MKKVPKWMRKVIGFIQYCPSADAGEKLLDELLAGEFNEVQFDRLCRNCHIVFAPDDSLRNGIFYSRSEALHAAGEDGRIESMQSVLHILLND